MSLSALLSLFLSAGASVMNPMALPNKQPTQKQIVQNKRNTKGSSTRVSPSGNFKRYGKPQVKQTFKQNRRKELNKSRKKKNKQF